MWKIALWLIVVAHEYRLTVQCCCTWALGIDKYANIQPGVGVRFFIIGMRVYRSAKGEDCNDPCINGFTLEQCTTC